MRIRTFWLEGHAEQLPSLWVSTLAPGVLNGVSLQWSLAALRIMHAIGVAFIGC